MQEIFGGFNVKDNIQADIFRETLRLFNQAAARGISESYDEAAITDAFLEQVRHNNEVFSAFRTHRMQNDIARQLLDGKGQLKSYEQFRRDVAPLTGKYCDQWLNTEYNTAVIRAHRAADWKHFETEKDVYPNLRWMPTTSAEPDPVHMKFWSSRLTLPVDDPFWDHHHPGERWGCKCTCEQTDEPVNDLGVHDDIPDTASKGLHGNPGQTGQLFSEDHPYYPKNCGSCPFNKGVRNRMSLFLNKKKDCESCQACANVVESIRRSKYPTEAEKKASYEKTEAFRKSIPAGQKLIVPIDSVDHLTELSISRSTVKCWRSHPHKYVIAKNDAITDIAKTLKDAEYVGWAEDDVIPGPNGSLIQKHSQVSYWKYYKVQIYDEESHICVMRTKEGIDVPYCINDRNTWASISNKVKSGEPPK